MSEKKMAPFEALEMLWDVAFVHSSSYPQLIDARKILGDAIPRRFKVRGSVVRAGLRPDSGAYAVIDNKNAVYVAYDIPDERTAQRIADIYEKESE